MPYISVMCETKSCVQMSPLEKCYALLLLPDSSLSLSNYQKC